MLSKLNKTFVAAFIGLAILVLLAHFAPWNTVKPQVEEWSFRQVWMTGGWQAFPALWNDTFARPGSTILWFSLIALGGGQITLYYLAIGVIAVGVFVVAYWVAEMLLKNHYWGLLLAFSVALHPWWLAGYTGRFIQGQVATLFFLVWFGLLIKYVRSDKTLSWPVTALLFFLPIVAGLFYPALTLLFPLVAATTPIIIGATKSKLFLPVIISVTSGMTLFLYTYVVSITAGGYQSRLSNSAHYGVIESLAIILNTLLRHGLLIVFATLLVVVLATVGFVNKAINPVQALAFVALFVGIPVSALTFASTPLHLNDPDRVFLPIGLALWVSAALVSTKLRPTLSNVSVRVLFASVVIVVIAYTASNLAVITNFANIQARVVTRIESLKDMLTGKRFIYVDKTGQVGDVYTLLPEIFPAAVQVTVGVASKSEPELCTANGVTRNHWVAARYPIPTTKDCDSFDLVGYEPIASDEYSEILVEQSQ